MLDKELRNEVRWLGELLGQTIATHSAPAHLTLVEQIRELAKARRIGFDTSERRLLELIDSLTPQEMDAVIRAFSIFFDLANLAEDRHRSRVLCLRETASDPEPQQESITAAIQKLARSAVDPTDLQELLLKLTIEPVFTAHPTEAKRKSLRERVRDIREHLNQLDSQLLTPNQRRQETEELQADLALLWQTDFVRDRRPTVLEELERSLFFFSTLWEILPELYNELASALKEYYPQHRFQIPTFLRFGTWIGGDRDGNPNVTWEVTRQAMVRLRKEVMIRHGKQCRLIRRWLSVSDQAVPVSSQIVDQIESAARQWPELEELLSPISTHESYRRFLRILEWRIERTGNSLPLQPLLPGAFSHPQQLLDALKLVDDNLGNLHPAARQRLRNWIRQIEVFGFHAMRLDIRQESSWYVAVMTEIFQQLNRHDHFGNAGEAERQQLLMESMNEHFSLDIDQLSPQGQETIRLFQLLAATIQREGPEALGCHIISMTRNPSDVLSVLWLGNWAARDGGISGGRLPMPIVPLFETIDDLTNGAETVHALMQNQSYRQHVADGGNRQWVMIGYSDSTKDGGYLAASWAQYQSQVAIRATATAHGVRAMFFHGRGGALGRGGGPMARSILSSPPQIIDGAMRVTEQGEVLSARYDAPPIAKRHLEQMISATLEVSLKPRTALNQIWLESMNGLAQTSLQAYRQLVEAEGFIEYFEQATPIAEIEQLPMGSRPSRRMGKRSLDKLRAIPWVFSWTQNRHILPAWYGLGSACDQLIQASPAGLERLTEMYQAWPYFHGLIENAALALAKADMGIGYHYAELCHDRKTSQAIWETIKDDYQKSVRAILAITHRENLLDEIPWLKMSIETRNPYVDPLNLIQVNLLKKIRLQSKPEVVTTANQLDSPTPPSNGGDSVEPLIELVRLSVQGIAAGLRTTG